MLLFKLVTTELLTFKNSLTQALPMPLNVPVPLTTAVLLLSAAAALTDCFTGLALKWSLSDGGLCMGLCCRLKAKPVHAEPRFRSIVLGIKRSKMIWRLDSGRQSHKAQQQAGASAASDTALPSHSAPWPTHVQWVHI